MRYGILMIVISLCLSAVCFADDSMSCGTDLVSTGDLKPAVQSKCGEPFIRQDIGGDGTRERWTYNFGSGGFMKILTFDGDRLESIQDGDKAE